MSERISIADIREAYGETDFEIVALVEAVEAAHAEYATLVAAPRGAFPLEDRLRDALARFDFTEPA